MSSVAVVQNIVVQIGATCRKYGMHCTPVCGKCRGVSCINSQLPDLSNDDMNDNNI